MAVGAGGLAALSGNASLHIGWLPFDEVTVKVWLLGLGAAGLLCVLLALAGVARWLLLLFALAASIILIKGLFFNNYTFNGIESGRDALWLATGSIVAVIGAIPIAKRRR